MLAHNTAPKELSSVSKSMLVVMIFTTVSKVTGFLREMVLAANFGTTYITDALKTAEDVPCLFLSIIITALCTTLIPVYSDRLKHGPRQANRFVSNLITIGLALSVVILLITALMTETIICKFSMVNSTPEAQSLAIQLTQIMLPMGVFVFLARIGTAYLQANFSFTVPALSQMVLNVVIIGAIMLSKGMNITYVAVGTVVGWALQFVVQMPKMRQVGLEYRPTFDVREPGLQEVVILMLPVLVSITFDQLYLTFDKSVASQVAGDITRLDQANRLSTMVSSVLLTTIATVLYPNLIRHVDDPVKMSGDLGFGINLNLLIALPAIAALVLLRGPITHLVYQRGAYTPESTAITADVLACYSAGILGVGMRELCNRCFYAFKDTKVPTITGIGVVVLNIGLNYALYPIFGVSGIAAATSISAMGSALVLLYLLHAKRHVFDVKRSATCLWKVLVATAAMVAVLLGLTQILHLNDLNGMRFYATIAGVMLAGGATYIVALIVLKTEELRMALNMIKGKIKRA